MCQGVCTVLTLGSTVAMLGGTIVIRVVTVLYHTDTELFYVGIAVKAYYCHSPPHWHLSEPT